MLIEARIGRLEILVKDLDEKNEKIFKVLNEFELFFNEFGNQNQENSATQVINAAREKRLQEIVNLGERYFEYQIFIIEYQEKLQEIDDAAKNAGALKKQLVLTNIELFDFFYVYVVIRIKIIMILLNT